MVSYYFYNFRSKRFDDIDMVAGATFSSEGFKEALDTAIEDIRDQQ